MTGKLPLVFNPRSGQGGVDPQALLARLSPEYRDRLQLVRLEPPFDYTPCIQQALAAGGPLLVWGGDGTLHHACRALVALGCPVALGAVPGGSGNGLVRGLRTPLDPAGAVMRLLEGRDLIMDLPRLDGDPFLNLCGTGFEAVVAHAFDQDPGRGFRTYARHAFRLWRSHPELRLRWQAERPLEHGPVLVQAAGLLHAEVAQEGPGQAGGMRTRGLGPDRSGQGQHQQQGQQQPGGSAPARLRPARAAHASGRR